MKTAGTLRAESTSMRSMVCLLVGLAACASPCEGQRTVAQGYVEPAALQPELARCAGLRVCLAPCIDAFGLTPDDEIVTCKVTVNASGGGYVEARYIDRSVCGANDVVDGTTGVVVVDDGSWDDTGDDTGDEGTPPDDGSGDEGTPPDDGSGSDGTPPDDGSGDDGTGDDGSSDFRAPTRLPRSPTHR